MQRAIVKQGEKVALIIPEPEDVEVLYLGINNPEIAQFLWSTSGLMTRAQEEEYLKKSSEDDSKRLLMIRNIATKHVIGGCDLHQISFEHRHGTIGIAIHDQSNHNKWYWSEALRLLSEYGFRELGLHKLIINARSNNPRAEYLYKKLGFTEVGRRRQQGRIRGERRDEIMMEMLREEWETMSNVSKKQESRTKKQEKIGT